MRPLIVQLVEDLKALGVARPRPDLISCSLPLLFSLLLLETITTFVHNQTYQRVSDYPALLHFLFSSALVPLTIMMSSDTARIWYSPAILLLLDEAWFDSSEYSCPAGYFQLWLFSSQLIVEQNHLIKPSCHPLFILNLSSNFLLAFILSQQQTVCTTPPSSPGVPFTSKALSRSQRSRQQVHKANIKLSTDSKCPSPRSTLATSTTLVATRPLRSTLLLSSAFTAPLSPLVPPLVRQTDTLIYSSIDMYTILTTTFNRPARGLRAPRW